MPRVSPRISPRSRQKRTPRAVHSELSRRDEGTGGSAGIVLPLNMVGSGMYEAVYAVTVQVGSNKQNFSLQVDTGSSDLWIASTSCSSTACGGSKGRQYDPSVSGVATETNFSIEYLVGNVSGPVYWDELHIGGYTIGNQALAAATIVESERLGPDFNGILGLALPLNSIIAHLIVPVTGDGRDGAPFTSNLFGITPTGSAPSSRFISLSLSRPGSDAVPSLLGIGRHPSQLVPDPSRVKYSTAVKGNQGNLFWEVEVHAITLYVDGSPSSINLDKPHSGNVFPAAVLDSGVPRILTSSKIANGIYGALGIGPAPDGQYYVPCKTPLNMTITFDGHSEIPLHPLDLTAISQTDPSSSTCVGLIQTGGGAMDTSPGGTDMILGVPFLRNVYTVMAYDNPDASGAFPTSSDPNILHPRVGLLSLTNATLAMQEFNNVRLLNQPLSSGNSSSPSSGATSSTGKLPVGVDVLLALVGIMVVCGTLFGLRFFLVRRQLRRSPHPDVADTKLGDASTLYPLAHNTSFSSTDLATARKSLERSIAGNSARTVVDQGAAAGEFGFRLHKDKSHEMERQVSYLNLDPGDPCGWRDTLVGSTVDFPVFQAAISTSGDPISSTHDAILAATGTAGLPIHRHTASDIGASPDEAGVAEPLLTHARDDSVLSSISAGGLPNVDNDDDLAEFGVGRESMAGIGTAARSPRIRTQHGGGGSLGSISLASLVSPGLDGRFPSLVPGQRLSASTYSIAEAANTIPKSPPP